ncbi:hypothetical protein BDZ97DRAFT_202500 [Flammula alnicola]|nr:hypothetical protein BDZ97DRAFT_202500 [Flammula alnicola]
MARVFAYLLAIVTVSASVYQVDAAPIESRQIGGLACNIARLKTVSGLAATTQAVNKIASGAGSDATVSSAATAAQSGLESASAGIKTIAGALLTGQNAPADARNQVAQGLTSAQTALDGINSTDPAVTSLVNAAKQKLQGTINAGSDVVSQCGGGLLLLLLEVPIVPFLPLPVLTALAQRMERRPAPQAWLLNVR